MEWRVGLGWTNSWELLKGRPQVIGGRGLGKTLALVGTSSVINMEWGGSCKGRE